MKAMKVNSVGGYRAQKKGRRKSIRSSALWHATWKCKAHLPSYPYEYIEFSAKTSKAWLKVWLAAN